MQTTRVARCLIIVNHWRERQQVQNKLQQLTFYQRINSVFKHMSEKWKRMKTNYQIIYVKMSYYFLAHLILVATTQHRERNQHQLQRQWYWQLATDNTYLL